MTPTVDIATSGRGGQIIYREGEHQAAIYGFVGSAVVRQQAPGGRFECDLERGELTIFSAR